MIEALLSSVREAWLGYIKSCPDLMMYDEDGAHACIPSRFRFYGEDDMGKDQKRFVQSKGLKNMLRSARMIHVAAEQERNTRSGVSGNNIYDLTEGDG